MTEKREQEMFHEVLKMYFSDSKLVTRSKRHCSIQEISRNSNQEDTQINEGYNCICNHLTV